MTEQELRALVRNAIAKHALRPHEGAAARLGVARDVAPDSLYQHAHGLSIVRLPITLFL